MTSPAAEEDRLLNWVIELSGTPSPAAEEPAENPVRDELSGKSLYRAPV